ncbi:MAG: glycosyltransferase [Thermoplasmatota archaeon]
MARLSVIIPVFEDDGRLAVCLRALEQQTLPQEDFEVIVVDNGSRTPPPIPGHVRLIHETTPGSYAARNAGIAAATTSRLIFTDADCVPEPGWLAALDQALDDTPRATGPVPLFIEGRRSAAAIYDCLFAFTQEANHAAGFGITANLAVRREVFDDVGMFSPVASIGDREFGQRAQAAGHEIAWAPDAIVLHPARQQLGPLLRKMRRLEGGEADTRPTTTGQRLREGLHVPWDLIRSRRQQHGFGPVATARGVAVLGLVKGVRLLERLRVSRGASRERR